MESAISCYVNDIPPFIEAALVRSYATLHSSLAFFKVYRSIAGVSCYVCPRPGQPSTVLLFALRGRRVTVLNEMVEVTPEELRCFAAYVFQRFDRVGTIRFNAIKTTTARFAYPSYQFNAKDTYIIALPASAQDYLASLGKSTRADIRKHINKAQRVFPSLTMAFFTGKDIDERHIRAIVRLSENKISAQGVTLSQDVDQIVALARMCGFVSVLSIDGRLCAGWISYRVGASFFGAVTGYDPQYEQYSVGKLCMHWTICESIARGGKQYSLGGGMFGYKERLSATLVGMDEVTIFRSYAGVLGNLHVLCHAMARAGLRRTKQALHRHRHTPLARVVFRLYFFVKNRIG